LARWRESVVVKATLATTLDGRIADAFGFWRPLCPYELARYRAMLDWADAVVVGARTVEHSDEAFLPPSEKKKFVRVVVDGRLSLLPTYKVFREKKAETIVVASSLAANKDKLARFSERGIEVKLLDELPLRPSSIVRLLQEAYQVRRVLVVGGGELLWHFLNENALDELRITLTPYVLGSGYSLARAPTETEFPGKKLFLKSFELCPCREELVVVYAAYTG